MVVGPPVVVVDPRFVDVVVVEPPGVEVVLVVAPPLVVLVVVEDDGCVVLVTPVLLDVVVVGVLVVVVVVGGGVDVPLTTPPRDVPVPALPKMEDSGLPTISSTTVTKSRAARKTTPAVLAMAFQVKRRVTTGAAEAEASIRWVPAVPAVALTSSGSVRPAAELCACIWAVSSAADGAAAEATASVGAADWSTLVAVVPPAAVDPSLRRTESSGARTTTCLTASWPRSIDCATRAVPIVAAAEPMATPTMVPLTPKADAISAANTAPPTEARIWRNENFTGD